MNTPTPETDAEFDHLRFVAEPNQFGCESQRDVVVFGMRDFARKLERERDELKRKYGYTYCAYCGESFEIDAPASVDAISIHIKQCNKHPMRSVEAERDQLRKVCDELVSIIDICKETYNQLPHVKNSPVE